MKRAIRRHHLRRMKAYAMRVRPYNPKAFTEADHLQVCSCQGCGNQRQHEGPPIRELRQFAAD